MKIQKKLLRKIILKSLFEEGYISKEDLINDIKATKKDRKLRRKMLTKYHPDYETEDEIFVDDRTEQFKIFMDAIKTPGFDFNSIPSFIDHSKKSAGGGEKTSSSKGINDYSKLLDAKDLYDFYTILEDINLKSPSTFVRDMLNKLSKALIGLYNNDLNSAIPTLMNVIPHRFMVASPGDIKFKLQTLVADYVN